jgi:hypothetical protein
MNAIPRRLKNEPTANERLLSRLLAAKKVAEQIICPSKRSTATISMKPSFSYLRRFAACRIAFNPTLPVSFRMKPTVAFGENSGTGLDRFLFFASLRFC